VLIYKSVTCLQNDLGGDKSFIQELNIQPVNIVSLSYGGGVTLQAMLQRPDLFYSGVHYGRTMVDHLVGSPDFERTVNEFRSGFGPMSKAIKVGNYDESALRFAEVVFGMAFGEVTQMSCYTQYIFFESLMY